MKSEKKYFKNKNTKNSAIAENLVFVRTKKALGQNFLKSEPALRKIIEAGEIKSDDVILEIGPGKGKLTEKLLEKAGLVIAVEKDRELFEFLKIKFKKEIKANTLILVCGDILNFNTNAYSLKPSAYKVIANIPYNITGAILKKFLTAKNQPASMVLMVQHEVAKRILASDKKESILSISVKAYGEPKMIMKVPARYFSPAPKVDSAIIVIKNISRKIFKENEVAEDRFWKIVKTGFAHKRKKLSSNLKILLKDKDYGGIAFVNSLGNKRAEDLSLLDWISLAKQ
ncbi:MAG: dimethyladenosine transferase [Candidatus Nomurabacteria bacterium GW2011_GWC2_41_8]|uniref:Ribosomal RNA small subunit methyltransferase A n=2 Tax=Candidatus Nomuraibacteriota TaxID=1752729 RepID=A0A0G0XHB2_9BACT|nr:MAG: dimethyladenosine transferase [Candidatus Nomurabacteria bacterium GW2011_GWA2_41_25]KKS24285.1 MAG: dimethyladenosine transferase [Candidatus Nomurabacteria bacterium GW2011_GWC2_41_8]